MRDRPQAYFIFCDDVNTSSDNNVDDNQSATEPSKEEPGQSNGNHHLEEPGLGRSRTASPYIEKHYGSGTIVRRRVIDQRPREPATTVINTVIFKLDLKTFTAKTNYTNVVHLYNFIVLV